MLFRVSKAAAHRLIAKAVAGHNAFENEHRTRMERLLSTPSWTCAKEKYRTVNIDEDNWFIRPHGSYDMDQKIERILQEVMREISRMNRRSPRTLRQWIEEAL